MSTYCLTFFFIDSATRSSSSDLKENLVPNMRLFEQEKSTQDARQPLATISSNNQDNVNTVKSQNCESTILVPEHFILLVCLMSVIESFLC
jgi:hypothetical protein